MKLFTFSISLALGPIASYFLSLKYVWAGASLGHLDSICACGNSSFSGDTTASALTAVFVANIVLVAYIVVSVQEESKARATTTTKGGETKKTQ